MAARVNRGLAATIAVSVAVAMAGVTASSAVAASTCTDGDQPTTQATSWGLQDQTRRPLPRRPEWAGVSMYGYASGLPGNFDAVQSSMQGLTDEDPAELTVHSGGWAPGDGALASSTVDGVTATGQVLTASSTATSSHTGATVDTVTGPTTGRYFVDAASSRATVNADGAAFATALADALPGVQAAFDVSGSPEVATLIAAMNAAIVSAPSAGDLLLDEPAYRLTNLVTSGDASTTGASTAVSVDRFEIGGLLTATGFASTAAIDFADGAGLNGRSTMSVPALTFLGLPVLETLTTAPAIDEDVDVVDTTNLPAMVRQAVTAELASVSDAARLVARDAGLGLGAEADRDDGDPATAGTGSLSGFLGDLPPGPDGSVDGHDVSVGGSNVGTGCQGAIPPVITDPTPIPTATPTITPVDPTITPVKVNPPVKVKVKQAPRGVAITSDDQPAG